MRGEAMEAATAIRMTPELEEEFVKTAKRLYGDLGPRRALEEAVALWLSQMQRPTSVDTERTLNNQAFLEMQGDLEARYWGKHVVIAHGKLQGVGDTFDEVKNLAPTARHRLVFRVGDVPAKERKLGWRIKRI